MHVIGLALHTFGPHRSVETLHQGVVVTISFPTPTDLDAVASQKRLIVVTGGLASPVRMMGVISLPSMFHDAIG